MIFQLVYRSQSKGIPGDEELSKILKVSRINNLKSAITGLLIYREKYFLQVLEGEEADVRDTFARIQKDQRHVQLEVVMESTSKTRLFPKWSMGNIPQHRINKSLSSIKPFLEVAAAHGKVDSSLVLPLFQKFIQGELLIESPSSVS